MTDVRGLAVQAVALRVLADKVTQRASEVRAALAEALDPGDRKTAALDDGTKVGTVTYTSAAWSARVTDPKAFADWVAAHYPTEVEVTVRPAFRDAVLRASKQACVPMTPDGQLDVPGVQVTKGDPYVAVRPDPAALPALVDAIRANQTLALDATP